MKIDGKGNVMPKVTHWDWKKLEDMTKGELIDCLQMAVDIIEGNEKELRERTEFLLNRNRG